MWSEQGFRTKARAYFERAEKAEPESATVLIWCLLGLEFILRAPLAKVSPALLAEPNGTSILASLGYKTTEGDAISIQTKTVIIRLATIVPDFTSDIQTDAKFLVSLRNAEVHTSDSPAEDIDRATWMPKFLRVLNAMASVFGETAKDYLNPDFCSHAERLSDEDDKRLEHEVRTRINKNRQFAAELNEEEKSTRRATAQIPNSDWGSKTECPACKEDVTAVYEVSRFGAEHFDSDSDEVVTPVFLVAKELNCPICKLQISGVREFKISGLPQDGNSETRESLSDRVLEGYDGPDYGND